VVAQFSGFMGNPTIFLGFDSSVKARNVNLGALPSAVAQQVRRMRPTLPTPNGPNAVPHATLAAIEG
jgi:hypothetical protein